MPMPLMQEASETQAPEAPGDKDAEPHKPEVTIVAPDKSHGAEMWRVMKGSGTLDENSSYAYLLFSRDFGGTTRIALMNGEVAGFVMGYRRPEAPDRYFVWQIAVDEKARGQRIGGRLLDEMVAALPGVNTLETTITDTNRPSQRLFESFAKRHGARVSSSPLFAAEDFPDEHEAERLFVIEGIGG